MGSDSNLPVMKSAAEFLEMFDVPHEVRIVSAHRTPELMFSYASSAHNEAYKLLLLALVAQLTCPVTIILDLNTCFLVSFVRVKV
ncbi:hypothetical protein Ahy_B07g087190 [Arachis hypogaea]|uniref:phosphoribosylaminoimidazole carboxylase n=1 Tax=Arachis hypogaea TaxID=3818 RepID=A0A444YBF7_ARAHY|nr:hypothetical protein Ahy_B07g087190 [Arachis hypogaea]